MLNVTEANDVPVVVSAPMYKPCHSLSEVVGAVVLVVITQVPVNLASLKKQYAWLNVVGIFVVYTFELFCVPVR